MLHAAPVRHDNGRLVVKVDGSTKGNRTSKQIDVPGLICTQDENVPRYIVGGRSKFGVTLNIYATSTNSIAVMLIPPECFEISKRTINVFIFAHMLSNASAEVFHAHPNFCRDAVPPTITTTAVLEALQTDRGEASPKQIVK